MKRARNLATLCESAVRHRRALHRIPEIGLELPRTRAYVEGALAAAGLQPRPCAGGVVCDLGSAGPLVALRADMDALPMAEETGLSFASEIPGAMHACAHDGHMAALLAAAEALAAEPPSGYRVRILFQPGEEGFFGAKAMIDAGVMEGVDAIAGGHLGDLSEELAPGQLGFMRGAMMAASDVFEGSFAGSGGHGSAPHQAKDPIPALAQFVAGAYALRSREPDQRRPLVVSVCRLEAGTAFNIIPGSASYKGTVRSLREAERELAKVGLERLARGLASAYGLEGDFIWKDGYPALVNDDGAVEACLKASRALLGDGAVKELSVPSMGGEDFAYYLGLAPGCFWFMNTQAPERGLRYPNHHPRFDLDEELLGRAAALHLALAEALASAAAGRGAP